MDLIDQYISQFEPFIQEKLQLLRQAFFEVNPETEESIRYQMPAFKVGSQYLYFAAYKKHIGFYPIYGLSSLADEFEEFRAKNAKSTLHFRYDQDLPLEFIKKIILLKSSQ